MPPSHANRITQAGKRPHCWLERQVWIALAAMVLVVLQCGCASPLKTGPQLAQESSRLQQQFLDLSPNVDPEEAARLAAASLEHAQTLARDYRAVRPPWLHNVLVNNGVRERGLCFEWTNDLFERLYPLRCESLDIHLAVARMDTRKEHNALVITAHGAPFESGIVLDAWRSSGRLWFGPAATDKYPWLPLPPDRVNPRLQELTRPPQIQQTLSNDSFIN